MKTAKLAMLGTWAGVHRKRHDGGHESDGQADGLPEVGHFCDLLNHTFREEEIGVSTYVRITVPPKIWFGFQGMSEKPSLVLNVANLPHDPAEVERKMKEEIYFNWQKDS